MKTLIPRIRAIALIRNGEPIETRVYDKPDSFVLVTPEGCTTESLPQFSEVNEGLSSI